MADPLSQRVLVLNRLWQAVNIVGVRRAFALLIQDHAQVIDPSDGTYQILSADEWIALSVEKPPADDKRCIHTVHMSLRIPSVLLLRYFDRVPTKEVKFNRFNIFERDNYRCQYCGNTFHPRQLNLDHVIPRVQGGKTSWENVVTSCIRCNTRKGNRLPHQAGMRLMRKPARPKWRPFINSVLDEESAIEREWEHFLAGSASRRHAALLGGEE
jgi:5-methylcytosine-specific restriction endonuclease McrA